MRVHARHKSRPGVVGPISIENKDTCMYIWRLCVRLLVRISLSLVHTIVYEPIMVYEYELS